ncbi:MAG: tRNA pseudouridine(38-40) synthase TruA, partial [Candidatus Dormibacteraeota bacterium]|nr:tRNA pseudouridine(38-40) synthase TruA [Candidatus Dormibacteraeota bacterium]
MPTYRLTVEYDGTDFSGWQVQPGRRTAMGVLRDAIVDLTSETPAMTAAGRTDAGAHAHGQVVGVTLDAAWEPERLRMALNARLPQDIAVVASALRAAGFDARRDALDRTYRYIVVCRDGRAPVTRRHSWTVRGPLDLAAMRQAAAHLVGRHDFAAFGRAPSAGGTTVRTVHEVSIDTAASGALDAVLLTVRADAFLRGMMRAFAGALVRVGQGRADAAWVRGLVELPAADVQHVTLAPARGLHQWSVRYGWDV